MKLTTIFGPPGTGKTTKLSTLIEDASHEFGRVLALSYTRAAASVLTERTDPNRVRASTLHSLMFGALGLSRASVVDFRKLNEFSRACGIPFQTKNEGEWEGQQEGDEYMAVFQFARNRLITLDAAYDHFGQPGQHDRFVMFCGAYTRWKQAMGYMDFDDMMEAGPEAVKNGRVPEYPAIVLDEAQDCSPLQWRTFEAVATRADRVYIAGDDDQAIYEWNGAWPHGMVEFAEKFGGMAIILDQSYRLPVEVHSFVQRMIVPQFSNRVNKIYRPTTKSGMVLRFGQFSDIPAMPKHGDGAEYMILVRDRWRLREIQRDLVADLVPHRVLGGPSPFDNAVGRAVRAIRRLENGATGLPDEERDALIGAGDSVTQQDARAGRFLAIAARGINAIPMQPRIRAFYDRADMLAPINVTLSTIHQAKGMESERVIVDLTLPQKVESSLYLDRDAELRVMYVAMTRAKDHLILCGENSLC